jgi:glycosyltransferase involved in cell wall biosynthesis
MKILYMVSHLGPTGPNRQLLNLVKNLPESGFKPAVLALSESKGMDLSPEFRNIGIDVFELGSMPWSMPGSAWRLWKLVSAYSPDILHSHGIRSDFLSALLMKRFRRVSTLRCNPYSDYGATFGTRLGGALGNLHLKALSTLDAAIACSSALSNIVAERRGLRFPSIQNGVDTEKFAPCGAVAKLEMRRRLGLPVEKRILLSAGSLNLQKDPFTIMEALDKVGDPAGAFLIMLGEGPLKSQCEDFGRRAGFGSLLPGNVDNVHEYLVAADYFVSSSLSEGLPNSVLEALAAGLPVCLSSIGPHLEILGRDPVIGTTASPGRSDEFAIALDALFAMERDRVSEAACYVARSRFSAKKMSGEYAQLYGSLRKA